MEEKKKELVEFKADSETLLNSKNEYFDSENEIKKQLKETLDLIDELVKTLKKQFETVSESDRTKYKYSNLYAETISGLVKNKIGILKDISTMNEKRLINSAKLRLELSMYKKDDNKDGSLDVLRLHSTLNNMFTPTN